MKHKIPNESNRSASTLSIILTAAHLLDHEDFAVLRRQAREFASPEMAKAYKQLIDMVEVIADCPLRLVLS